MPVPVTAPLASPRIDISFMRPDMVLVPTDLSGVREQNRQVQLTPEQWRIFTRADGRTTLQMASQLLVMSPEQVCQVAGELVALNLLLVVVPGQALPEGGMLAQGMGAFAAQGYAAPTLSAPQGQGGLNYMETESQWGNGGNGATFMVGRGWGMPAQGQPEMPQNYAPQGTFPAFAGDGRY
jgi:hypothetical protein